MARSSTTRVKGQPSLNPGGRPKIAPAVREALTNLTPQAIDNLKEFLASDDKQERMFATKEVLDRNLGKPVQPTDNKHSAGDGEPLGIEVVFVKPGKG